MTDDERKARNREKTARFRARHRERALAQGRASRRKWRAAHQVESIAAVRVSYAKHREKYLARRKVQWSLRTEAERADARAQWSKCRERRNTQRRIRREADVEAARLRDAARRSQPGYSEKALARTAEWARKHPDWWRALQRKTDAKRRAIKKAVFVEAVDPRIVFERDCGVCGICRREVDVTSHWEVDHVIPIAKGGLHSYANVQLAHRRCNRTKAAKVA